MGGKVGGKVEGKVGRKLGGEQQVKKRQTPKPPSSRGELCLNRVRSGETLMEAHSDTDVQIVRYTWV